MALAHSPDLVRRASAALDTGTNGVVLPTLRLSSSKPAPAPHKKWTRVRGGRGQQHSSSSRRGSTYTLHGGAAERAAKIAAQAESAADCMQRTLRRTLQGPGGGGGGAAAREINLVHQRHGDAQRMIATIGHGQQQQAQTTQRLSPTRCASSHQAQVLDLQKGTAAVSNAVNERLQGLCSTVRPDGVQTSSTSKYLGSYLQERNLPAVQPSQVTLNGEGFLPSVTAFAHGREHIQDRDRTGTHNAPKPHPKPRHSTRPLQARRGQPVLFVDKLRRQQQAQDEHYRARERNGERGLRSPVDAVYLAGNKPKLSTRDDMVSPGILENTRQRLEQLKKDRVSKDSRSFAVGEWVQVRKDGRVFRDTFSAVMGNWTDDDAGHCGKRGQIEAIEKTAHGMIITVNDKQFPSVCLARSSEPKKPKLKKKKKINAKKLWMKANVKHNAKLGDIVQDRINKARALERKFFAAIKGAIALNAKAKQQQMQNLLDSLPPSEQPGALDEDDDDEGDDAEDDDEAALEGEPMEGETDEDAYARIKGKWKAARVGVTGAAQVVNTTKERKDFRAHLREQADDKAEREAREAAEAARLAAAAGKVKRRSSKIRKLPPRPAAHAVSDVTEFANSTATTDGDKTKWYKFVWCNRCGFGPEESVNIDQFNSALEKVHKNLFSPKQVTFFMKALDIVQETSKQEVPYNYTMFVTLAALAERVKQLEHIMLGHIDEMDFTNAKGLEHKIVEARKMFYLAESAKTTGVMSWDDLDITCAAGGVDGDVVDDIKDQFMMAGKTGVEFLDFLSYLPLFIQNQMGMRNNPLGEVHAPRKHTRASRPGNFDVEDRARVKGQSSKFSIGDAGAGLADVDYKHTSQDHSNTRHRRESDYDGAQQW